MKKLFLLSLFCMFSLSLVACTNKDEIVKEDIYDENLDEADKYIEYEKEVEGVMTYIDEAGYQFKDDNRKVAEWALNNADYVLGGLGVEYVNYTEDEYLVAIIITSLYDDFDKVKEYKKSIINEDKTLTEQEFVFVIFDRGRGMIENEAFFNAINRYEVLDTIFSDMIQEDDKDTFAR